MANPAQDIDFQIATYAAGIGALVTLASLGVPNPHPIWNPSVSRAKLGDNSGRLLGAPTLKWQWGFVSQAARDALRTYCPGGTAQVIIITPTTETVASIPPVPNAPFRFACELWWPAPDTPEDPNAGRRLQFVILFKQLMSI